jgi:copper chaperone NosL
MPTPVPTLSRLLTAAAAVLLLGAFAFPVWRIDLEAPQYPEGIGMRIRVNTVEGIQPTDLENINALNHYIGMKAIRPDAIPELRYMPWVVGGLAAAGLAAAAWGRRRALVAWLGAFLAAGLAGLADFWRWGYDYGHDLDPQAIIKIPGMAYQPPLIGSKQLLNFTAHSWPDVGGVLAGLAFGLGVLALVVAARAGRDGLTSQRPALPPRAARAVAALLLAAGLVPLAACAPAGPRPVAYGQEPCANCRMTISDRRFGAELVTAKGKLHAFDSIECVAAFALAQTAAPRGVWVTDYDRPGTLLAADSAEFRRLAGAAGSPMGKGLVATRRGQTPRAAGAADAPPMGWDDVLATMRAEGMVGEASHGH